MLSLSTIELRSSRSNLAVDQAKANARLGLMIALGELQKQMGPDQRISARATILDTDSKTEEVDGVSHPGYLGIWDSWDTWLTDKKGSLALNDTYQAGRHPTLFRRWLVSHPNETWVTNWESAMDGALPEDLALMVGEGTLGTAGATDDEVRVPKVTVQGESGEDQGSYAYWVGDESQKARLDLHTDTDALAGDFQLTQLRSSQLSQYGIDQLEGLTNLDASKNNVPKLLTLESAELAGADKDEVQANFHSLTTSSWMVLSNTKSSGLKHDLSLLFERDEMPAEMKRAELFHGVEFDTPIRPMTGELAKISPQNPYVAPTSWREMREYYRLYRTFDTGDQTARSLLWSGSSPYTRRFMVGKKNHSHIVDVADTDGYMRQPVLLRQTWVLATRTQSIPAPNNQQTHRCYIVGVPVFHLWNPYNLEMKMGSRELAFVAAIDLAANLKYRLYKSGVLTADKDFNLGRETGASYAAYQARPIGTGGGDITFKPGEVIAFTVDEAVGAKEFDATFGYKPLADTSATRGLQLRLKSLEPVLPANRPSMALRFHTRPSKDDNYWWGNSASGVTVGTYQHNFGQYGAFDESGQKITGGRGHNSTVFAAHSIDWLTPSEDNSWIVKDDNVHRAEWDFTTTTPQPFAILSMTAKGAEHFDFDGVTSGYASDFRNRTWLHSPPTNISHYLMNPTDLNRSDSAYQIFFKPVNGDQEVSQYLQVNGRNGFFGGGFSAAEGQSFVPVYELPTSPAISLADFSTMQLRHARAHTMQHQDSGTPNPGGSPYPMYSLKHIAHSGAGFGSGIGNGYAHPMIPADQIYHRNQFGTDRGHPIASFQGTNISAFDDYWDHLFLTNEALWDSYYFSSMLTDSSRGSGSDNLEDNMSNFFMRGSKFKPLSNRLFRPFTSDDSSTVMTELEKTDGWKKSAAYLMSKGPFNVNTTSVEAWKALLWGLQDRDIPYLDTATGDLKTAKANKDEILLSRFRLANSGGQGSDATDADSWQGVRRLSADQVNRLAEEIVKQVKMRGPFLNMAEFINRRLSDDELGVTGALQAAIDWDEFDANYNGSGSNSSESINHNYKNNADMISTLPANYPNPPAARGSRFAGIPGYVMQSDLLQAVGNSLTARGDTFRIRAYGEARSTDGTVLARAWCEAIVQRYPDYTSPSDDPWEAAKLEDGSDNPNLSSINHTFGRKFRMVSFRWINSKDV
jgi:hypothetical protein